MFPRLRNLILTFLFCPAILAAFPSFVHAKEVILWVHNTEPSLSVRKNDVGNGRMGFFRFRSFLFKLNSSAELVEVSAPNMTYFSLTLEQMLEAGKVFSKSDVIRGVVLAGHGNPLSLQLSENATEDGASVASLLLFGLRGLKLSSNFSIHVSACSCGKDIKDEDNFSQAFMKTFLQEARARGLNFETVNLSAHGYLADRFAPLTERGWLSRILYSKKSLRMQERLDYWSGDSKFRDRAYRASLATLPYLVGFGLGYLTGSPEAGFISWIGSQIAVLNFSQNSHSHRGILRLYQANHDEMDLDPKISEGADTLRKSFSGSVCKAVLTTPETAQ